VNPYKIKKKVTYFERYSGKEQTFSFQKGGIGTQEEGMWPKQECNPAGQIFNLVVSCLAPRVHGVM
jgi:hypothetical protein